ncbi:hypothetical protein [Clostridium weizhouense]|uniref:Uncharacterized protein n=1 Tax=Clostridium weizhouense TaxID=2859781 RepID=A0ABS7AIY1_9CLOT|nr:hypothetical protein [Clostridium weizhouense]MBW6408624.1 hypothetical protein [Clostridium weizhouense]
MDKKKLSQINKSKNKSLRLNKNKKKRLNKRKKKKLIKSYLRISLVLFAIISIGFFTAKKLYIMNKCSDLAYSVEHNFTSGLSNKNKLLRVQEMDLIYSDGKTAVVEASGLSKSEPHKQTSLQGNFRKDKNNSWILEEIYPLVSSND